MGLFSFLNLRNGSQNGFSKVKNHKHLSLRMEPLEERQMLAVTALEPADAFAINQAYPELAVTAGMNAIEISATEMTATALNNALLEAKGTLGENDIILIRGTGSINGTYNININAETEGSVLVVAMGDDSVILNSGYAGNGQANLRIMDVSGNTNITFAGINFTNGRTTANNAGGGALYVNEGATVTLVNSEITGNVSTRQFGGAIANEGTLNIYNSLIAGNQAQVLTGEDQDSQTPPKAGYGSGIFAAEGSHTLLVNVTVADNKCIRSRGRIGFDAWN